MKVYRGLGLNQTQFEQLQQQAQYQHQPGWRHFEIGYPRDRVFISDSREIALSYTQASVAQPIPTLLTFEVDPSKLAVDICSYNFQPDRYSEEQNRKLFGPTWPEVKKKLAASLEQYGSTDLPDKTYVDPQESKQFFKTEAEAEGFEEDLEFEEDFEPPRWASEESFYTWIEHYTPWVQY